MNLQDLKIKVDQAVTLATVDSLYTKDNLLCYSVALQPHFLVWSASLVLSRNITQETREICEENAQEEFFGMTDEGCHFLLSRNFFRRIGPMEGVHYSKAESEVEGIYKHLKNHKIILTVLTCIETCLAEITLPKMLDAMRVFGVTNFDYIDVHKVADNTESGHSMKFLSALVSENPTAEEIEIGTRLFVNLFKKIFE